MAVSFGTIRAVNPVSLAEVSGATKVPGFASSPISPVIRPDVLTSQLMGFHPQCCHCNGDSAGPTGQSGVASYIPPDYGTLRGLARNGEYGIFKLLSSGGMGAFGKGTTGTNAAYYGTPSWRWSQRGLGAFGKGTTGTNAAYYGTPAWRWSQRGLGGLGQTTTGTQDQDLQKTLDNILSAFRPGANEADAIVQQAQNPLMANLNTITNQFLTSTNPSVATLQGLYTQVSNMANSFKVFVLSPKFTDRRASGQALNSVMPIIDGTCGYAVPLGMTATPSQFNCTTWGDGTLGGPGTTGMLGALQRAIANAGGRTPFVTTAGISSLAGLSPTTLILIALGIVVLSRMR